MSINLHRTWSWNYRSKGYYTGVLLQAVSRALEEHKSSLASTGSQDHFFVHRTIFLSSLQLESMTLRKRTWETKGPQTFAEAWDKDDTKLELAVSQGVMRKSPFSCIQESSTWNSVILTSGPTLNVFWIDVPLTESTESISPPFSTSIRKVIGNSACPYPVERWSEDENRKFPSSNCTFNVEGFLGNIFLRDLEKRGLARLPFPRTGSFYMSTQQKI